MVETTMYSLVGFVDFIAYFIVAIGLFGVFVRVYTWLTPHDEMELVLDNNTAAAVALSGALIGFALPLASAVTHSVTLLDCVIWGAIALAMQALTFLVLRVALPRLPERIVRGDMAAAVLIAGVSIAIGLLNAASMTY